MTTSSTRTEQQVFQELEALCRSPGYIHALAALVWRDGMIGFAGHVKPADTQHLFERERLIRTEVSTLTGLMLKGAVDYSLPAPDVLQRYCDDSERLLAELHELMVASLRGAITPEAITAGTLDALSKGEALREPFFYGADSAYVSQYRDLSAKRYQNDSEWLERNKGFNAEHGRAVMLAIRDLQNKKLKKHLKSLDRTRPETWTVLPSFSVAIKEVAGRSGLSEQLVECVLNVFSVPDSGCNEGFKTLHDFNLVNARPLIRKADGSYWLFLQYSLAESLYESPYYWMAADKAYEATASINRGAFTEQFSGERLGSVFVGNTYTNVSVYGPNGDLLAEIDTLVLFGDRALVLQAKAKKLTLKARGGDDEQIRDDFKKSVQDSYDQAHRCAEALLEKKNRFVTKDGVQIAIPALKAIYPMCVVAEHYPALSMQASEFLKLHAPSVIKPPFVLDVFTLDVVLEFLSSPLRVLSYIDRRVGYAEKVNASHELTIFAYHLRKNLWMPGEYNFMHLEDDIAIDLDIAMAARRDGVPGKRTPDGVLTRFNQTSLGRLIKAIEASPNPALLDLGFMLLTLGEETVLTLSRAIDRLSQMTRADGGTHDVTVSIGQHDSGLTVHCNDHPPGISGPRLQDHCARRKYSEHANSWFGICLSSELAPRFGVNLTQPWQYDAAMEERTKDLPRPSSLAEFLSPHAAGKKSRT